MGSVSYVVLAVLMAVCYFNGCSALLGTTQKVKVTGQFFCQQTPAKANGIKVYLKDQDKLDKDDMMDETTTDDEGRFTIGGKEKEFTTIDPYLAVYHDCNDVDATGLIKNVPCQRKWKLKIPDLYVDGANETAIMDVGRINLEIKFPGEGHDCFH